MTILQQAFAFDSTGTEKRARRANLVIEAGAGTGKTTAIVAEVLKLMLEERDLSPERIVLVTFTEKAAGEIADRIHAALAELELVPDGAPVAWPVGSPSPLLTFPAERGAAIRAACARQLSRIHLLRSQTIHSFCQSLLRQFPLEAGVDPQFRVIEGFERSLLYEQLYDEWVDLETRVERDRAKLEEWELLLADASYLFAVRNRIFALVERRDLLAEEYSFGDIAEIEDDLRHHVETIRNADLDGLDAPSLRTFTYMKGAPLPKRGDVDGWLQWLTPVAVALRELDLPKGRRHADVKEALQWLRTSKNKGKSIFDRLTSHRAAMALHAMTRRFLAHLDAEKRKAGVVDFDDLLLRTLAVLDDPAVLERARAQYDYIFVDEFQDTDRTQAKIVDRLARDASGRFVPGRTIVVGDPKQSIYGFRRADPETYYQTTKKMIAEGAERRPITIQYRSDAPLLDAVNAMFTELFPAETVHDPNVFRPPYDPLTAGKSGLLRDLDARLTFLRFTHDESADRTTAEAEAIARWIVDHRDGSAHDLSRFAILFRRLTQIDDYLDVFERLGIDYVLPPTRFFLDRRVPVDLVAVLRAIAWPFDRGAAVSAARSPYFALDDEEIARGVLTDDGALECSDTSAWNEFKAVMERFRAASAQLTIAQLIDLIVATSGIESVYAQTTGAERAARHLEHLRAIAFDYDRTQGGSVREFVSEIDRRREESDEAEPLLVDEMRNAVNIMSVHAAKGLEFETVILPDLAFAGGGGEGAQIFAVEQPPSLVMRQPDSISAKFRFTPNGEPLSDVASARDEAESRRLFYVAVTRAKSDVVFLCNQASSVPTRSFLGALCEVFGPLKEMEWPAEREVRTMTIGSASVPVAFECAAQCETGTRVQQRLTDEKLEEELRTGPLVPLALPMPAAVPPLTASEIAATRAQSGSVEAGILLHRTLEMWDGTSKIDLLLGALAAECAATPAVVSRVRQRLSRLQSSPMAARIRAAETVGRELLIHVMDENGVPVERRIDRLIRENGREVVIDYKSGSPTPARLEHDRAQVARYCAAISAMTGRECGGVVWYISDDREKVEEVESKDEG